MLAECVRACGACLPSAARAGFSVSAAFSLVCLFVTSAFAQTGGLEGAVRDERTGDPIVGANVILVGTTLGASTDLDGEYKIKGIPAGTYDVRVFYAGYEARVLQRIRVDTGRTTKLAASLAPVGGEKSATFTIEDLRVTADRVLSTATAVLTERMRAATIGDAISAEQISRSPDATSGDALKRVTGLSVVDNKYVFVRGVTDRYNATTLNGISVSSTDTDVDRKSFAFDLIPSSLLSNTVVVKTATPDLPGDFSGGLVQVNTLEFPTERVIRLSVAGSSNSLTTSKFRRTAQGGSRDWLGKDDGTRTQEEVRSQYTGTALAQNLRNTWGLGGGTAPFNESYSLSYGDRFAPGGRELGIIGGLTYKSDHETADFVEQSQPGGVRDDIYGTRYRSTVLWGGLVNLNFKLADNHRLSFKNNFIRSAKEDIAEATGKPASADSVKKQTNEWNERTLYLGQFGGTHKFPFFSSVLGKNGLDLDWKGHYSRTAAKEPDRKNINYHPHAWIDTIWILAENHRTWSDLSEEAYGLDVDFKHEMRKTKFKAGAAYSVRQREFKVEAWYTDPSFLDFDYQLLSILPPDQIFAPENYGVDEEGRQKFRFTAWTDLTGEYAGKHDIFASYGMIDTPFRTFGQRFRAVVGLRAEQSDQKVDTKVLVADVSDDTETSSRIDELDFLPSFNLTYLMTDLMNLRLAYYRSVNRPEFREMSNVKYFDFQRMRNVKGAPGLKRAELENYDARLEFFPDVGEVLAGSFFYKTMENAIEERLLASPDRYVQTWENSPEGKNYGFELEARKALGFLFWDYLKNVSIGANYTKIYSNVKFEDPPKSGNYGERPLQGQAPWMVNASLEYTEPTLGMTLSLLYNRFGRRLDSVGDSREQDVYEEESELIDLAVSQDVAGSAKLKFTVKNLTSEDDVFTWGSTRQVQERIKRGATYALSLSYTF